MTTHLEFVLEKVFLVGQLAIEAENLLFFLIQRLGKLLAVITRPWLVQLTLMSTLFFW